MWSLLVSALITVPCEFQIKREMESALFEQNQVHLSSQAPETQSPQSLSQIQELVSQMEIRHNHCR
ncbi:MAG: hypothetical protein ACK5P6_03630 [Pseudobdellovibrionaceae bacterium]|jgi:hypothetical protein